MAKGRSTPAFFSITTGVAVIESARSALIKRADEKDMIQCKSGDDELAAIDEFVATATASTRHLYSSSAIS